MYLYLFNNIHVTRTTRTETRPIPKIYIDIYIYYSLYVWDIKSELGEFSEQLLKN